MIHRRAKQVDPDEQLVRRIRDGDAGAFSAIVDRHGAGLYRVALAMCGNGADAEVLVQDSFVAAFEGVAAFAGKAMLRTWLTRILMNLAAQHRRRENVRKAARLGAVSEPAARQAEGGKDFEIDFHEALNSLEEPFREVVVLRELMGMSYDEIGEALQIAAGTVESRLFRGRQKLKELLADYLPPDDVLRSRRSEQ